MAASFDPLRVIIALQRLQNHPELLSVEHYSEPPPPYSASGETTRPPTPPETSTPEDRAYYNPLGATPHGLFDMLSHREGERIVHQSVRERNGRRQTLPFDPTADLLANGENNVRALWIEQGIWKEEWGPAWPRGAQGYDRCWLASPANTGRPSPGGTWGHDKYELKIPGSQPAPEPEPKPRLVRNIFSGLMQEEPNTAATARLDMAKTPAASVRDTKASRPYHQFHFQVSKEREWLQDEHYGQTENLDINAMAYQNIKDFWKEYGIWDPTWGELPGMTWAYENLRPKDPQPSALQPDASSNNEQLSRLVTPDSEPTSSISRNDLRSDNPFTVPDEVDPPSGVMAPVGGKRKRKATELATTNEGSTNDSVDRGARPSKAMKHSESQPTVPSTKQNPACKNDQAPNKRPSRTRKSELEQQQQPNPRTGNATTQLSLPGVRNNTKQRRPTGKKQLNTEVLLRRSARIAQQRLNAPTRRR